MDTYQEPIDSERPNQADSIRTFVYSDLPEREKEKFMEFMIKNNVEFVMDDDGNYVATISFVLSNNTQQKPETNENNREVLDRNQEVQELDYNEVGDNNQENKDRILKERNSEIVEDSSPEQPVVTNRDKSPTVKQPRKNDVPKSARGGRSKSPLTTTGVGSSNISKPSPKIESDPPKTKVVTKRKQAAENFEEYDSLLKLVGSIAGLRAKKMNANILMSLIEDLYTARFMKDTMHFKAQLKKGTGEEISNKTFTDFIYEFYKKKHKSNKKNMQQACYDLVSSVEFHK